MNDKTDGFVGMVAGPSFRDQARQYIRGLIVTGQMQRDEIYSVPSIAAQLQVSATPVREALLDLSREGLLEPVRNRGFRVVALSPKELSDTFAIRLLLEVPSIADLARKGPTTAQMAELRRLAGVILRAATESDRIRFLEADRQFHIALIDLLENKVLSETVATLRDRVRLFGLADPRTKDHLATSASEHFELLQAIEDCDAEAAGAVMKQHLERSRDLWAAAALPANDSAVAANAPVDRLDQPV